jgi:putative inorganic carbon (hco3(-)) transporter
MIFPIFLVYLAFSYIFPAEVFPALIPYRIPYWFGVVGMILCALDLLVRREPLHRPQFWFLSMFVGMLGISLMVAEHWPGAPIAAATRFAPSFTMFTLALFSVTSLRRLKIAVGTMMVCSLFLAAQGIAAYHFGYGGDQFLLLPHATNEVSAADDKPTSDAADEESTDDGGSELTRIRGLGMFHDPNDLAVALVIALGLVLVPTDSNSIVRRILVSAVAAGLGYAIFLTYSRGGALASLVVLCHRFSARLGRTRAVAVAAVVALAIIAADFGGGRTLMALDESASNRVVAWSEGLEMLKSSPLFGIGFGQFLDRHSLTAHNSFVLCFAETGIVGYFFWIGLIVITVLELRALRRPVDGDAVSREITRWAHALYFALVGFLVAGFFLSRTFTPILYLILGLSGALSVVAARSGRRIVVPRPFQLTAVVAACEVFTIAVVYAIVKLHIA